MTLEITEHALLRDTDQALTTLRGLKEIGVKVAIDDFGTGYSSLAQLKTLPVDTLKIDQGFVRDLGVSADDLAIVTLDRRPGPILRPATRRRRRRNRAGRGNSAGTGLHPSAGIPVRQAPHRSGR